MAEGGSVFLRSVFLRSAFLRSAFLRSAFLRLAFLRLVFLRSVFVSFVLVHVEPLQGRRGGKPERQAWAGTVQRRSAVHSRNILDSPRFRRFALS